MPADSGVVHAVERQLRRVTWRWNLREIQRALYLGIAASAGAAALLVLLALHAPAVVFAPATWSLGGAVLAILIVLVIRAGLLWLPARRAPAWVDCRGGLEGRLVTLLEMWPEGAGAFFWPLLAEQNRLRLGLWEPQRLVPNGVPRAAFAAACVTSVALLLAAVPWGRQPAPVQGSGPGAPVGREDPESVRTEQRPVPAPDSREGTHRSNSTSAGVETSINLAASPRALRDAIRRRLVAGNGEPARSQGALGMAQDTTQPASTLEERGSRAMGDQGPARNPAKHPAQTLAQELAEQRPARRSAMVGPNSSRARAGDRAQSSAGSGTSPETLFARPGAGRPAGASFELKLGAAARNAQDASGHTRSEPPPAATDARPALAVPRRRQAAINRMDLPPAYESVVRSIFARRAGEGSQP